MPDGDDDAPVADDDDGGGGEKEGGENEGDRKEYRAGNCNDCNRQFCLDYNLPICKGAGMEDVFTTCFREFGFFLLWGWVLGGGMKGGVGEDG